MRYRILNYQVVDSTNSVCRDLAEKGAAEGLVVKADYQTSGRGRFERKWISPRGKNLLFSVLLRPKVDSRRVPLLTIVAAESVAELLSGLRLPVKIKKPNDVLVRRKKIAGILSESASVGKKVNYVVVGIGLNVNADTRGLPPEATSIVRETSAAPVREELFEKFLGIFDTRYKKFIRDAR